MNTLSFNDFFIIGDGPCYICADISKLKGNFEIDDTVRQFQFGEEDDGHGIYEIFTNGESFNDYEIPVTLEFFKLNLQLTAAHPGYQMMFDEMVEKDIISFSFALCTDRRFILKPNVTEKHAYWFCGQAFQIKSHVKYLKFIDLEKK